jgi:peroxiredoxin
MNASSSRISLARSTALLLTVVVVAGASDQLPILHPAKERKPAPDFALKDSSDATVKLTDYRGKVVLLDFWATWCTGCKQELPWFSDFQKTYGPKGLAVVGVSLDEGGWKVLRPFLAVAKVPYKILLGNESTAHRFGIANLPDTLLIDRQGRVAAAYIARLVDRADIEAKIKVLVSEP